MTRVAAIQLVSTDDIDTNLNVTDVLIGQAVTDRAELVVLPENFPFMGMQEEDKLAVAEPSGEGPLQDFLAEQAKSREIWLVGGTIPMKASRPDRIRAASLLYNPAGECVARYDKIHLFDVSVSENTEVYCESGTIEPGDSLVVAETPLGNIGMSVCYDLRFPEMYRRMHAQDVNIIIVPSAFTNTTGMAHWGPLLKARAIENLSYVIAPNQGGLHVNNRETWGHSMILNPWGDVLAVMDRGEGFVCADIELEQLNKLRNNFPVLKHRKLNS